MTTHPLDHVHAFIGRFVSYPSPEAQTAHALWIAHAFFMDHWDSTPRLAFLSPEPGSGKSRALEVTALLVPRPVETVNATPAYGLRWSACFDVRFWLAQCEALMSRMGWRVQRVIATP